MSASAVFFVHGAVSGSWAPRIAEIKENLSLEDGDLGLALAGLAVGTLVGTRLAGIPVDRVGTRGPLRVGLPIMCVALVAPGLAQSLGALALGFALLGAVAGFLDVVMNANGVGVEREIRRSIMSSLHGFWSVGLFAGAAGGTGAAAVGLGVAAHFALVALVLAPLTVVVTRGLLATRAASGVGEALQRPRGLPALALLLGVVAFSSFAAEGSAADWSSVYMHDDVGVGAGAAGLAFVAFSIGMTATRFAGDALTARLGPDVVTRVGGLVAAAGMSAALLVPRPLPVIAGYALLGVGLAPIVPIAFSAAGNVDPRRAGVVLGWVVTMGYLAVVVGPIAIGFTADAVGLRTALVLPILLALTAAALAFSCRADGRARR
jgi:MFS family permease